MAPTYTTKLGLRKPNVADFYDIADANFNADTVDTHIQVTACTLATRPGTPWDGQLIYQTDTDTFFAYITGTGWRPQLVGLRPMLVETANGSTALLRSELVNSATLAGNRLLDARLAGAANPGFQIDFDGKMQWGPGGASAPDTNLYRDLIGTLATDHAFYSKSATMIAQQAVDAANRTTTSTTFTDTLATGSALAITCTVPPSGKLEITIACRMYPTTAGQVAQTSARISGGNTVASAYERALSVSDTTTDRRGLSWIATGLNVGTSVTVTMQHSIGSGTGNFDFRSLSVKPLFG